MQTATTSKLYKTSMLCTLTQAPVRCSNTPLRSSRKLNKNSISIHIRAADSLVRVRIHITSLCPSLMVAVMINILATLLLNISLSLLPSHHIHSMQTLHSNTLSPTYIRPQPLTTILQELRHFPKAPMPVPPFPPPFPSSPYQQRIATPWTPNQPPLDWPDSRRNHAVPLYELPPPDLMEYVMGYMIAIRMLPEWNKGKEDGHWDQVRRERSAAMRLELSEDRDLCTIM